MTTITTIEPPSKRAEIREAAAQLFRDKGYAATSMRDLAEAVGLKAPSIYNHFASKEEILRSICFDNAQRFLNGLSQIERMPGSAADKLRALIRLHILIATEDATSVIAINDEWRHLTEPYLSRFVAIRREYEQRFKAIVEQGVQCGKLRNVHPHIAVHTIFSSMRWLHDWYKPGKSITPTDIERDIEGILMEGLVCGE